MDRKQIKKKVESAIFNHYSNEKRVALLVDLVVGLTNKKETK